MVSPCKTADVSQQTSRLGVLLNHLSSEDITKAPALNSGHNGKVPLAVYDFILLHPSSV